MNDYMKLREIYTHNLCKANDKALGKFFKQLETLQKDICKHEKTQWLQEITKEGDFKDGLFKRCLNCNLTLDTIECSQEEIEKILAKFDNDCETLKSALSSGNPTEMKQP